MKRRLKLSAVLSLLLATSATMLAQAQKDAHIGTWKLNVAKSKFNPGPGYKSETRTYEATADGYKFQGERVNPDGSTPKYGFTVKYDNKNYPVTGKDPGGADTIAVKLVDANDIESTSKKGHEVLYTSKVMVSPDRKMMTITTKGKNPDGEPFDDVQVYDRQE
ncbi:MAG: hypothetical protein DMG30_21255 [Acidobacteria bacterium]|nr:MAG: hypothetical protein DMG30_21255 [Acidobacteriota bacterium]